MKNKLLFKNVLKNKNNSKSNTGCIILSRQILNNQPTEYTTVFFIANTVMTVNCLPTIAALIDALSNVKTIFTRAIRALLTK